MLQHRKNIKIEKRIGEEKVFKVIQVNACSKASLSMGWTVLNSSVILLKWFRNVFKKITRHDIIQVFHAFWGYA